MQKLSGNNSGKNNKSCRVFYQESNKIGFAFFDYSKIFYGFYNIKPKVKHYLRTQLSPRSLELSNTSQICPWFAQNSLDKNLSTQLGSQPWPVAVRPKSGQSGGVLGQEKDGEGARAHLGLDCDRSWGCGGAGEVTRRSWVAAAACVATPVTRRRGPNNTRHREVLRTLGTRLGRLGGGGTSCNRELAVGAPMAGQRSQ
jgi:hypothetical protein